MLLARTDWDVPKHRGHHLLRARHAPARRRGPAAAADDRPRLVQRGVPRPTPRVPADHVVGDVDDGWAVAHTTLAHERRYGAVVGERSCGRRPGPGRRRGPAEADAHDRTYRWYPQRAGRADLLGRWRAAAGRAGAPTVGQQVSGLEAMMRTSVDGRAGPRRRALGRPPGAEGSLGKLAMSRVARAAAVAHAHLAGADGLLARPDAPGDGIVAEVLVSTPAQSIAGGTDEIQKTIVAERILGLPREPQPDRDQPFRHVAHAAHASDRPADRLTASGAGWSPMRRIRARSPGRARLTARRPGSSPG